MKWIWLAITFMLLYIICPPYAHAEARFSIHPALIKAEIIKDSKAEISITLKNDSEETLDIHTQFIPFIPSLKNDGTVELMRYPNAAYQSLFGNISINGKREIILSPYESKSIAIEIVAAQKIPQQDYYFTLLFVTNNDLISKTSSSSIESGVGANIILSYQNNSKSRFLITQFSTDFFGLHGPVIFAPSVSNTNSKVGSIEGEIDITNMFGQRIAQIPLKNILILAHSSRYLESKANKNIESINPQIVWDEGFLFGIYKATLRISNVDSENTASIYFIRIPLNYLISLILISVFASGVVIGIRKRLLIKR